MTILLLRTDTTKGNNIWMSDLWELKALAAWRML